MLIAVMDKQEKELFESALKDYPAPTPEEVSQARKLLDADAKIRQAVSLEPPTRRDSAAAALVSTAFFSIPGIICGFLFRGGALLYLFGIAVQTMDGSRASRLRCLLRAVVAWSPLLLPYLAIVAGHESIGTELLWILFPLAVLGAIYTIIRPERGIQDRIAGTYLVPRWADLQFTLGSPEMWYATGGWPGCGS